MNPKWFANSVAYSIAKFGMSLCVLGMAEEFKEQGVAVNALWPRTAIATAAVKNILGGDETVKVSRTPEIMADAAYVILTKDSKEFTGNFCIDDNLLADNGVKDFSKYADFQPLAKKVNTSLKLKKFPLHLFGSLNRIFSYLFGEY